jgi:glycosyltransferase involved in cell wall biosynthesis
MVANLHISIVLPAYNRKTYLIEGLKSIALQSFTDWSLIVVDDGSIEDIETVVRDFSVQLRQQVQYIKQPNSGAGAARQRALELCNGDAVAFMDSDDPWLPNHLADVAMVFREQPDCDWVGGPARIVDERSGLTVTENSYYRDGSRHPILSLEHINFDSYRLITDPNLFGCLIRSYLPGGIQASALRRRFYKKVRFLPVRLYDDTIFQLECFARGAKLAMLHSNQIIYRIHNNNLSFVGGDAISPERRIKGYQDAEAAFSYLYGVEGLNDKYREYVRDRIANDLFWKLAPALMEANRSKEASQARMKALKLVGYRNLGMLKSLIAKGLKDILGRRTNP